MRLKFRYLVLQILYPLDKNSTSNATNANIISSRDLLQLISDNLHTLYGDMGSARIG